MEIIKVGHYRVRFASSQSDVASAQSLRYRCFNLSNDIQRDVDDFDIICKPIGRPSEVKPHGRDNAGEPVSVTADTIFNHSI